MLSCISAISETIYKVQTPVKKVYNIVDYGAIADGKTMNTKAIQEAINLAHDNKQGGKVVIPKGTFLIGSIEMKRGLRQNSFFLILTNFQYKKAFPFPS